MRKVLELIVCIFHPFAVVLIWAGLYVRKELGLAAKITWGIAVLVPLVPFLYVLTGNEIFPRD